MNPFPLWTMVPFAVLVLCIAALPLVSPKAWERHAFQATVVLACTAPIVAFLWLGGHGDHLIAAASSYVSFAVTLGALYVAATGIFVEGDLEPTPRVNVAFVLGGAMLASLIGTTGASILLIRPLLRTNRQRVHKGHLVPFFILAVANAGGLLTPLGDPPLLLGYFEGVPFLWTLKLVPFWVLYVGAITLILYVIERRAYALEPVKVRARDPSEAVRIAILGKRNVVLLLGIAGAILLPAGWREAVIVAIAAASYVATPRDVHEKNGFAFGPVIEVAILFAGLFLCLVPIEANLAHAAPTLPIHHAWQLFWGAGLLSAVLDNAPTYAAFTALARGTSYGEHVLVAGVAPLKLAAISVGSVVMGATTYIGNGPNLMVRTIAERSGYRTPSFFRYALFAMTVLGPVHLVVTAALVWLER